MASRTTFPTTSSSPSSSSSSFVNYRARAQVRAWVTYHESQESHTNNNAVDAEDESNGEFQRAAAAGEGASQSQQRRKKRERESGSPEVGRKVVRQLGKHDRRLTETFRPSPSGAFPIFVPSYDDPPHDGDWNPKHEQTMGGHKRAGGVRPTNTLSKSTPQATAETFWSPHVNRTAGLSTQTVAGHNVRKVEVDEAFASHQAGERRSKKQKPNPPGGPPQKSSSEAIDLTSEELLGLDRFSAIALPKNRNGPMPTQSASLRRSVKHVHDPFATNELSQADSYTTDAKRSGSSKRRRGNESRSGSQRSSVRGTVQSPSIEILDSSVEELGQNRHSPMVIVDSQESGHSAHAQSGKGRTPPRIDLERGYPQGKLDPQRANPKTSRGSQQDLKETNKMLAPTTKPVRSTNKPPIPPRTARGKVAAHDSPRGTQNLRTQFKRDSNQTKAIDRMREDSRDRLSSPDELDGLKTIARHTSPRKESVATPRTSARRIDAHQRQSSPASVYQPPIKRVASPPSECNTDDIIDEGRIPIHSIFSKQCVKEQQDLALVWNSEDNEFLVACGDETVRLPYQDALVTIGKHDVGTAWQHNRDIAKAMLKGSSTDYSNGTIIIDFVDCHGLSACYNWLMHATHDNMRSVPASVQYMEKCFANQRETSLEAHQRLCETLKSRRSIPNPPVGRRAGWQVVQDQSEDDIKYDEHDSATLSEVLAQKQNEDADGEQSRYFPQDSVRKSTRQVRSTVAKRRTPSPPPRWSEQNPTVTWQHPVVYPSQGARRVTVYDSDVPRLDEGEYLNDNLLGFAIRHIEETMSQEHRQKVHFFNTFFYSTLMKTPRKLDYDAVKRWTKNIDIFTVPYTIVPINNHVHWYFAIICNMQFLDRKLSGNDGETAELSQSSAVAVGDEADEEAPPQASNGTERDPDDGTGMDIIAFDDDGRVAQATVAATLSRGSTASAKSSKKKAAPTRKYDTTAPVIIMLDSLGHARPAELNALKRYIQAEAKDKRAMDVDTTDIQGINAKGLPQQPNFCDCGVYVVGYMLEFAKDPDAFVKRLLRREMDPDDDFGHFNAPELRNSIRGTLLRVAGKQEDERKAEKAQRKAKTAQAGALASASKQSSPVRLPQTSQASQSASIAVQRAASAPAPSAAKSQRSSPIPTSRTLGREQSSPAQAMPDMAGSEDEKEDEGDLEVSAPTGLTHASRRVVSRESSSELSSDSDEEMLDDGDDNQTGVLASRAGASGKFPSNPYSHNAVSSTASSLTAFTSRKASSAGSARDMEAAEIADSQGRGYD